MNVNDTCPRCIRPPRSRLPQRGGVVSARAECPAAGCPAMRPCPEHGPTQEVHDGRRTEVLTAFVEQVAEELSGCCPECDACVQIVRQMAGDEVVS